MSLGVGLKLGRSGGGRGAAALVPAFGPELYADDFESPAGSTPTGGGTFVGRDGWTVTGAGGAAELRVDDGYAHNAVLFAADKTALLGSLPADVRVRFGYGTTSLDPYGDNIDYESGRQSYLAWYHDADNYLQVSIDLNISRLTLSLVVNGSNAGGVAFNGLTFKDSGEIYLEILGGRLFTRLDGQWLWKNDGLNGDYAWPYDSAYLTAQTDPAKRAGAVGFRAGTFRWRALEDISASPLYVSLGEVSNFVPRGGKNSTRGSLPLSGTYAVKTPVTGVYRVREYLDDAVAQGWRAMTAFVADGGEWSGQATIPVGGPYTLDVGYIDAAGEWWVTTSRDVSCGALICIYGQSNSVSRAGNITVPVDARDRFAIADTVAAPAAGRWLSAALNAEMPLSPTRPTLLAKNLAALIGVPVATVVAGYPATGIGALSPGGDTWDRESGGSPGIGGFGWLSDTFGLTGIEAVVWDQGENDADSGLPPTGYADTFLEVLLPGLRTATGNPTLPVLIDPIGRYAGVDPPANFVDSNRELLRQHYLMCLAGDPHVHFGASHLGLEHGDEYHYIDVAYAEICRRDAWSIAKYVYGADTHDGMGPQATGASRSGAAITLSLDLGGAAGLSGPTYFDTGTVPDQPAGAMYGYQVSDDDFATLLEITDVARSGDTIVITLSADPGGPVKVRSMYGWSYDDTTLFYGEYDDTDPIPVRPIMTPLETPS